MYDLQETTHAISAAAKLLAFQNVKLWHNIGISLRLITNDINITVMTPSVILVPDTNAQTYNNNNILFVVSEDTQVLRRWRNIPRSRHKSRSCENLTDGFFAKCLLVLKLCHQNCSMHFILLYFRSKVSEQQILQNLKNSAFTSLENVYATLNASVYKDCQCLVLTNLACQVKEYSAGQVDRRWLLLRLSRIANHQFVVVC